MGNARKLITAALEAARTQQREENIKDQADKET
jgi:hypothetical protein